MKIKIDDSKKSMISYAGLFLVAMIWGLAFVAVKSGLDYVPPGYMIAFRFSIAAFGSMVIFRRKYKKEEVIHGIIVGFFLFISYLSQTIGCKYTTAGKNAFLTALYIMIVPFVHWFLAKKRPELKSFIAAIIALIGIGLISLNGDRGINIGDLLTILCGFLFAIQIAVLDKYAKDDDPMVLTSMQLVTCAILGWITAPFIEGEIPTSVFNPTAIVCILYLALGSTLVCVFLQTLCQKYTKPENASLIMSSESLFGALGSIIILHEVMSAKTLLGCLLLIIAILISQISIRGKGK